jgi:T-complex protein 1 subunit theta
MNFQRAALTELLKEGSKHIQGVDAAVLRNIEAVKNLGNITKTSLGPNGMNKMVVNRLDKLFVTHDAATIVKELEVIHPAANICVMASQAQEQECGDGTNLVICLTGEFLSQAENLLRIGLHTSDIIQGYKKAVEQAKKILEENVVADVKDVRDKAEVEKAMRAAVAAKLHGYENQLVPLIAEACITACPKNPKNFNIDNVRVVKISGGAVSDSSLIHGFAIEGDTHGQIKHVQNAKIAVYGVSIDASSTETKNTVLIKNRDDLLNYNLSEEKAMEREIQEIAAAGCNVVVTQGSFGEMAMHFIQKYGLMAIKCSSKFQIRRLCKAVGATTMVRLGKPTPEEIGECDSVDVVEIGDRKVIVFKQVKHQTPVSTIVVRGATKNVLDEIERAVDDGVNVFKTLTKDNRLVAGAGAIELELYNKLLSYAEETPGLDQYAIRKFAEAFLVVPRAIAESSGLVATDVIATLTAAHQEGKKFYGVDIESSEGVDAVKEGILDCFSTKYWAIHYATDAALTILNVDQIIMARPAGGPKPRQPNANWDDDENAAL